MCRIRRAVLCTVMEMSDSDSMTEDSFTAQKHPVVLHNTEINSLETETFVDNHNAHVSWKTLISAPKTSTDSITVGLATCPPKHGRLPCHRHAHAEVYHVISGSGHVYVDGEEHSVSSGSVVYIPGDAEHGMRNDHPDEELKWLYVFGANSFEEIKYRFSA